MDDLIPLGVAIDPRPEVKKKLDYLHEERYCGLPVVWTELDLKNLVLPSPRYQATSSSCVMQSTASALEVLAGNVMSAGTYNLRANYPEPGMWLQNAGDLSKNTGVVLEVDCYSQGLNEPQMNSIVQPKKYKIKATGYVTFRNPDIEVIAQAIQSYGNCLLTFNSNSAEWTITPTYYGQKTTFAHCICGLRYGLVKGVKTIVCRDSAGSSSIRYITQDFLNKRNTGALYYTGATVVPEYTWLQNFISWLKVNL